MTETKNLVEGLTDQILRVTEIQMEYLSLPNIAGYLAATAMGYSLDAARKAQASGSIEEMMAAYKDLEEYEL